VSISVRFARPADAASIHALIVALAVYEREPDAVRVTPVTLAAQLESDHPPFECLLAEEDGVVRGFALFFHTYSTWEGRRGVWLEDLFVPEEHRGRGIGKRLLAELARITVERGCARLEWSVLDWNEPSIAFYEALGAKRMATWSLFRLTGGALDAVAVALSAR
jgi:GNAT superfamily N-acetyltransferase